MSLLGFEEASRPRSTLGSGSLGTRNGRGGAAKAVLRRQRTVEAVRHSAGDCASRQRGACVLRDTSSFHLSVRIGKPSVAQARESKRITVICVVESQVQC